MEPINDYEEVKSISSEDFDKDEKILSTKGFSWNDIFYNNINNDFSNILNTIGQTGVFLIRPQSKKAGLTDHAYVSVDLNVIDPKLKNNSF
jgi:hypothetical protein